MIDAIEAFVLMMLLFFAGWLVHLASHAIAVLHAKHEDAARKKRAGSSGPGV